jgi:hypothetical protein
LHRTNKSNQQEDKSGSKQVSENPKTYVIVLETGDEVLASLNGFARAEHLAASSFKAIGALSSVELGWFNWDSKEYQIAVKLDERGGHTCYGGLWPASWGAACILGDERVHGRSGPGAAAGAAK